MAETVGSADAANNKPLSIDKDGNPVKDEYYQTIKAPTPQYDDFLNDLFAKKRHQAYKRCEIVERRTEAIK